MYIVVVPQDAACEEIECKDQSSSGDELSDEEDDEAKEERRKQLAVLEKEKVCIYACVCTYVCVCTHSLSCTVDYIYTLSTYCVGECSVQRREA